MILQIGALMLKVPLNLWFIFGGLGVPAFGGPGARIASTLINWLIALSAWMMLMRVRRLSAVRRVFTPLLAGVATPGSAAASSAFRWDFYLIEVTSYTFMALFIARFGTTTLAGHQITGNIGAVLYMTPLSIGFASATLVAQALGAQLRGAPSLVAPRHPDGGAIACVTARRSSCCGLTCSKRYTPIRRSCSGRHAARWRSSFATTCSTRCRSPPRSCCARTRWRSCRP